MSLNRLLDSGQTISSVPDVQTTTFSADGIGRYICNTWDEVLNAQGSHPFDVLIVGSGMYGGYCAAKLFEFGEALPASVRPRILVLESGPFLISQHVQNLPRLGSLDTIVARSLVDPSQVQPPNAGFVPHHRCVGGKSLFWGGWTPRLTDDDFAKGWPQEVVEYLTTTAAAGQEKTDGYQAVEQENGTWPVADFINGALFEILRAGASELLSDPSKPPPLLSVPGLATAAGRKAWSQFKARAPAATWNTLSQAQKDSLFQGLSQVGQELDAPPTFSPVNPPIAVLGDSPGAGLFAMDKFSSLPLLSDAIRDGAARAGGSDPARRLFLLPNAEVLRLETSEATVRQVAIALRDPFNPDDRSRARVVRLDLKPGALVVLAGNTINSTRLALNSFPRPALLEPRSELIGRNLMAHVRGNFFWRIERAALHVPPQLPSELETAALHIRGRTATAKGPGQFHFQFYATPNQFAEATSPEQFLYLMVPNLEDLQTILASQQAGKIVVGIRSTGETFGDRDSPIGTRFDVGWVSVNPFGGLGDDVYVENGQPLRIPKVFVNLVETAEDTAVRTAQTTTAFAFVAALCGQPEAAAHRTAETDPADPTKSIQFLALSSGQDAAGTTYHESGTMWIGSDPATSVTDINGRFHHISNAYCTDQSLFPSVGSANPTNTGLTLTRMLARRVIDRYQSSPAEPIEAGFDLLYRGDFTADGWRYEGPHFNGEVPFYDVTGDPQPILGAGKEDAGFASVLGVLWFGTRAYQDFVLKLDWRAFDARANSGIFLRAPEPLILDEVNFYNSAIEVQIDERGFHFNPPDSVYGSPRHKTGAVYGVFPARQWAARVIGLRGTAFTGLWNSYEIRVVGAQIDVTLNGTVVCTGTFQNLQPPETPAQPNNDPTRKRAEGFIGLQCHTDVVQFRNIRIKPIALAANP